MTLIEGIGDEVTHFFIGLIVVLVVTAAWWTTSISEHRHTQTVWLLDRRRLRRLTNHTQTVTINEGILSSSSADNINSLGEETASSANTVIEASTSVDTNETNEEEEEEQNQIVETMDSEANVLRQRRLAFYNRNTASGADLPDNSDDIIMEHNYASRETSEESNNVVEEVVTDNDGHLNEESEIRIKLKYINDDMKLVDGKLQELLGDFKKRHFHDELSSNKLVRLIFNGQVLQQDSKTLQGCGFFDNCVVHCLIHQKRTMNSNEANRDDRGENFSSINRNRTSQSNNNNNNNNNNNHQARDWDLGNFLFMIITFTLLSAWYFRYVYAHLYTVTATIGLMLMTAVFTIVLIGMRFPDQEQVPPRRENAQSL